MEASKPNTQRTAPFPWDERDEWFVKLIVWGGLATVVVALTLLIIADMLGKTH